MEVLRKEEEHRQLHKRQECHCEVIFDAEERERRLRPRGKGKGKGKELARIEVGGLSGGEGVAGLAGVADVAGCAGGASVVDKAWGVKTGDAGTDTRPVMVEAGTSCTRQDWAPDTQMATYQYVGYHNGGNFNGPGLGQQEHSGLPIEEHNQMALAHRPGYPAGGGVGRMDLEQVAAGQGFPVGGFIPREHLWVGQLEIGQPGAGMKWYPEQNGEANMPPVPDIYTSPTKILDKMPRVWQRAKSEPAEKISNTASPAANFTELVAVPDNEPQQPAIVSSDMAAS
jgi:hypothetical protein